MPPLFRHRALTYLRGAALVIALALAAASPPAIALPFLSVTAASGMRAWYYWCSMLLGAAPYLSVGGLAAAASERWERSSARRQRATLALAGFAMLFPGCDCTMNAYAASLRGARPSLAAFALVWGTCCNPLALISTATILGPRMVACRLLCGCLAAAGTALAWSHSPVLSASHHCDATGGFWESFVRFTGKALASFALAAAISSLFLASAAGVRIPGGPMVAALTGALLSPCSSADSLLARILFARAPDQLAFIIAAQCLDVRQVILLGRSFGWARTVGACVAATLACAVGCFVAARS